MRQSQSVGCSAPQYPGPIGHWEGGGWGREGWRRWEGEEGGKERNEGRRGRWEGGGGEETHVAGDGSQKVWQWRKGGMRGEEGGVGGREAKDELERTMNTLHEVMVR